MRFPLKQPWSVGVWSRHGKKLKLAAKIRLTKCYLMTLYICIPETDFKCYLQKKKRDFKLHLQTSRGFLDESFFHNVLEL